MSKLSDVLYLIKAGYSKKEIEELLKTANEPEGNKTPEGGKEPEGDKTPDQGKKLPDGASNLTTDQVNELITNLSKEVEDLRKATQELNRSTLTIGSSGKEPETADSILSGLLNSPREDNNNN